MSELLTSDEVKLLHYVREKRIIQTGEVMRDLGLTERRANECLHVLEDLGHVEFTDSTGFIGSREELIIAKITGKGIQADDGRLANASSLPQTSVQMIGNNYGVVVQAPQGTVIVQINDAFKPFLDEISSKKDVSNYEKEDLKKKILDLQEAIDRKDKAKFDSIQSWISKYAPTLVSIFSNPQVIELIRKAFDG